MAPGKQKMSAEKKREKSRAREERAKISDKQRLATLSSMRELAAQHPDCQVMMAWPGAGPVPDSTKRGSIQNGFNAGLAVELVTVPKGLYQPSVHDGFGHPYVPFNVAYGKPPPRAAQSARAAHGEGPPRMYSKKFDDIHDSDSEDGNNGPEGSSQPCNDVNCNECRGRRSGQQFGSHALFGGLMGVSNGGGAGPGAFPMGQFPLSGEGVSAEAIAAFGHHLMAGANGQAPVSSRAYKEALAAAEKCGLNQTNFGNFGEAIGDGSSRAGASSSSRAAAAAAPAPEESVYEIGEFIDVIPQAHRLTLCGVSGRHGRRAI